jgi:spermidine synthase
MNTGLAEQRSMPSRPTRFLPLLVVLFVGSGSAALIYEIVWFQMLSQIIGSSAISLGVVLAIFMGGMCIGSVGLSYVVPARLHPLRVYAILELTIGLLGVLVLLALPWVDGLYTVIGGGGMGGLAARAFLSALLLLPPTILMGATLPAIARWVEATPKGVSWLGFFYGGNIAGAVFGSLLAGFFLLQKHDTAVATYTAAAINLGVAAIGLLLAELGAHQPNSDADDPAAASVPPGAWPVLVAMGLSGMTALGAEVVWTRLLSLTLGGTVYTFSLILAAFLIGLGLGSGAGSFLARSIRNPRAALSLCQLLVMGGLAWAAYALTTALPYWPIDPSLASSPSNNFQIDFVRCLLTVVPGAILWGLSFPLALAAVASEEQDAGHLVGRVYAANTVGAIIGALSVSLLLIGTIGTQQTHRVLIGVAGISSLILLGPLVSDSAHRLTFKVRSLAPTAVIVGVAVVLGVGIAPVPGLLVAYGRYAATWVQSAGDIIYVGEGTHSSLAVSREPNGTLSYHNAGKIQASSFPQDMRLQRMLGHFTTLVPDDPRSVLVIGMGAGVTAGAVSIDPRVNRVTIVEIEPLVPEVVSDYFSDHNFGVATNPKVQFRIDDGRHYLLTTDETFDAITSDPLDPWVKGAANLYTLEFWELVKQRLNPGGVVTVFVQLYESGAEAVKSEIATFLEAFPNGTIWANTVNGQGYDLVLMGQLEPTHIDIDVLDERLQQPAYTEVRGSLSEVGIDSVLDLLSTYAGRADELGPWLEDADINRDRNLRLQYLAGLGINRYEQDLIYRQMLSYITYPEELFVGPGDALASLRGVITGGAQP